MRRPDRPPGRPDAPSPHALAVPRSGGGIRWITRLDPAGESRYRAAVRPLAGRIERSLGPEALAIRLRPRGGSWLAPWGPARGAWRASLRGALGAARPGTWFAVADVRACYASIEPEVLEELLGPGAAHAAAFLRALRERGARGLPVGPEPSAVLANAVLSRLDAALRGAGVTHLRWVDDLVWWGRRGDVVRAMSTLAREAASLGLDLHGGKTRILADRNEARAVTLSGRDSSIIGAR